MTSRTGNRPGRFWRSRVVAPAMLLCVAGPVSARELELPLVWCWDEPLGAAAGNDRLMRLVRVKVFVGAAGMTGEQAADAVCDEIAARGLGPGGVAILLQDFAIGDGEPGNPYQEGVALVYHHADGLPNHAVAQWWRTPWMVNGIAETRAWMDAFIARYQWRQALDPSIPDPSRFHFDNEAYATVCCDKASVAVFDKMRQDPRWATQRVPGFVDPVSGGARTMSQLYVLAGLPAYDATKACDATAANQAWFRWYSGVCAQAVEGGMDEAVYQPIRTAWPGCLSSDYGRSLRVDGLGDPARVNIDPGRAGALWAWYAWAGFGDMQAPVLYLVDPMHQEFGESRFDASMRVFRLNMTACINSFGAGHEWSVAPWISMIGQEFTKDQLRDVMAMARAKGVGELIEWSTGSASTPDNWTAFQSMLHQVWDAAVTDAAPSIGVPDPGQGHALLSLSRDDSFVIRSATNNPNMTRLLVGFETGFQDARRLRVTVESRMTLEGGQVQVWIRDWAAQGGGPNAVWDSLGAAAVGTDKSAAAFNDNSAAGHVRADGRIELLVQHSQATFLPAITSWYDLVQVVERAAPCAGDFDVDEAVGFADVTAVLLNWGGAGPAGDGNGDGTVDFRDITSVLLSWGVCP